MNELHRLQIIKGLVDDDYFIKISDDGTIMLIPKSNEWKEKLDMELEEENEK